MIIDLMARKGKGKGKAKETTKREKEKPRRQLPPGRVKESLAPWLYVMSQLIRMKAGRIRMKRKFQDEG